MGFQCAKFFFFWKPLALGTTCIKPCTDTSNPGIKLYEWANCVMKKCTLVERLGRFDLSLQREFWNSIALFFELNFSVWDGCKWRNWYSTIIVGWNTKFKFNFNIAICIELNYCSQIVCITRQIWKFLWVSFSMKHVSLLIITTDTL